MSYFDNIKNQWIKPKILPNVEIDREISKITNHIILNLKDFSQYQKIPVKELVPKILENTSMDLQIIKKDLKNEAKVDPRFVIANKIDYHTLLLMTRVYSELGGKYARVYVDQSILIQLTLMYMSLHRKFWPVHMDGNILEYVIAKKLPKNGLWRVFNSPLKFLMNSKETFIRNYGKEFSKMDLKGQVRINVLTYNRMKSVFTNIAIKYYEVYKTKEHLTNTNPQEKIEEVAHVLVNEGVKSFSFRPYTTNVINDCKKLFGVPVVSSKNLFEWISKNSKEFESILSTTVYITKPESFSDIMTKTYKDRVFSNLKSKATKGNTIKIKGVIDNVLTNFYDDKMNREYSSLSIDSVNKLRKCTLYLIYYHILEIAKFNN